MLSPPPQILSSGIWLLLAIVQIYLLFVIRLYGREQKADHGVRCSFLSSCILHPPPTPVEFFSPPPLVVRLSLLRMATSPPSLSCPSHNPLWRTLALTVARGPVGHRTSPNLTPSSATCRCTAPRAVSQTVRSCSPGTPTPPPSLSLSSPPDSRSALQRIASMLKRLSPLLPPRLPSPRTLSLALPPPSLHLGFLTRVGFRGGSSFLLEDIPLGHPASDPWSTGSHRRSLSTDFPSSASATHANANAKAAGAFGRPTGAEDEDDEGSYYYAAPPLAGGSGGGYPPVPQGTYDERPMVYDDGHHHHHHGSDQLQQSQHPLQQQQHFALPPSSSSSYEPGQPFPLHEQQAYVQQQQQQQQQQQGRF